MKWHKPILSFHLQLSCPSRINPLCVFTHCMYKDEKRRKKNPVILKWNLLSMCTYLRILSFSRNWIKLNRWIVSCAQYVARCFRFSLNVYWIESTPIKGWKSQREEKDKSSVGEGMHVQKIMVSKNIKYQKESCCAKCKTMVIPPAPPCLVFNSVQRLSKVRRALPLPGMRCGVTLS